MNNDAKCLKFLNDNKHPKISVNLHLAYSIGIKAAILYEYLFNNYLIKNKETAHTTDGYSFCDLDIVQLRKETSISSSEFYKEINVLINKKMVVTFNNHTSYYINFDPILIEVILDKGELLKKLARNKK